MAWCRGIAGTLLLAADMTGPPARERTHARARGETGPGEPSLQALAPRTEPRLARPPGLPQHDRPVQQDRRAERAPCGGHQPQPRGTACRRPTLWPPAKGPLPRKWRVLFAFGFDFLRQKKNGVNLLHELNLLADAMHANVKQVSNSRARERDSARCE